MINFVPAEVEGQSTEFLDLKNDKCDFGIQLVSWGVDMIGVGGGETENLAANMQST